MKTLKNIYHWIDNYFATVFMVLIGFSFFYYQFKEPNVDQADDLLEVQGSIQEYSFQRTAGYRTPGNQYYIWLDNYPCTFQIKADFLPFFSQTRFETDVRKGDNLKITIAKDFESNLWDKSSQISIFSVEKDPIIFLNAEETIAKENGLSIMYTGLFFIGAGVVYYLIKRKKLQKNYR